MVVDLVNFETITPILNIMGSKSVYCGSPGSVGSKTCNNSF